MFFFARRPKCGNINCYEVKGIVSAYFRWINGYTPKPGIFFDRRYVALVQIDEYCVLRECNSDPGYVVLRCTHFHEVRMIGAAKSHGDGLFSFSRVFGGSIQFASGTDGYESSIELGFEVTWDTVKNRFRCRKLRHSEALAVVDRRPLGLYTGAAS